MKPIPYPVDFCRFLIFWNQSQRQTTPEVHMRMANWLQERYVAGDKRLLLMAFRSCGKSSIIGVFAAWLLYANPDLRIMVIAAEGTLARKMVRNVRRIIEKHVLTQGLRPSTADQWAGERFTINRRLELRDPSMLARGMDANITGSRADIIICDDVEVPKTSSSVDKREALREKLGELDFILAPGGTILYVGTPHSWYTIYAREVRMEIAEADIFLKGYERLEVPILDEDGQSAWPERYSVEEIERLRLSTGANKFQSQMMLVPTNTDDGHLDIMLLKRYCGEIDYTREIDHLELNGMKIIDCCAFWDPAIGGKDGSVVAIVFVAENYELFLHRVVYLRKGSNIDPLGNQLQQLGKVLKENFVPSLVVETNGVGATLPALLRRHLGEQNVPCAVIGRATTDNKNKRIQEAFETIMAAGMLHVHEQVYATAFIREMQEWSPKIKNGRDDGLDAVASALGLRKPRIEIKKESGRLSWRESSGIQQAETGFEV